MPIAKCPRCDKLFDKAEFPVCTNCRPAEEEDYQIVREALDHTPDMNPEQVSEVSGVAVECILRMIDSGMIASAAALQSTDTRCGRCGAPAISATKRLCQGCLEQLNREVVQTQKSIKIAVKKDIVIGSTNVRSHLEGKRRT